MRRQADCRPDDNQRTNELAKYTETYGLIHIVLHWTVAAHDRRAAAARAVDDRSRLLRPLVQKRPLTCTAPSASCSALVLMPGCCGDWATCSPHRCRLPAGREWPRRPRICYFTCCRCYWCISGYLISTADGRAVDVFGWFEIPATLQGIEGQEDIAGEIHFILAMILLAVIALHILAALRHHFILKDRTMSRMLKSKNTSERMEEKQ